MSSRKCPCSIRRVQKTCTKYMAMSSRRETRARQQEQQQEKENPPQIALASERFLASSAPRVIDLSRARRRTHGTPRTSRTSRDAYAKRDNAKTSNSELDFPVGETFGFAPPTSDMHIPCMYACLVYMLRIGCKYVCYTHVHIHIDKLQT